jgi:hypothetical protein
VLIYNMLSLNGMRPFGVKSKNKTIRAWPKADNIIPLEAGCYIWYRVETQPEMGGACTSP